jgi:hypothetical protein
MWICVSAHLEVECLAENRPSFTVFLQYFLSLKLSGLDYMPQAVGSVPYNIRKRNPNML